jgi:hypothetical protein
MGNSDNEKALGLDDRTQKLAKLKARSEELVAVLDRLDAGVSYAGIEYNTMKVRFAGDVHGECLIIATGWDHDGTPVVTFHSGVGAHQALLTFLQRVQNGTLKWRPDEYAKR